MLSNVDRELLQRCLNRSASGWDEFVGRYIALVRHVVFHTANSRSVSLDSVTTEELISDVFFEILENDFAVLRRFRLQSSLATYLTVIARRIVVRRMGKAKKSHRRERKSSAANLAQALDYSANGNSSSRGADIETREEIEAALSALSGEEQRAVRMYYLEGRNYREISTEMGLSENSIGPYLTRAREKMRQNRIPNS